MFTANQEVWGRLSFQQRLWPHDCLPGWQVLRSVSGIRWVRRQRSLFSGVACAHMQLPTESQVRKCIVLGLKVAYKHYISSSHSNTVFNAWIMAPIFLFPNCTKVLSFSRRPLNSPYVACVPRDMDLTEITCLKDNDCVGGEFCRNFQCVSANSGLVHKTIFSSL